MEEQPSVELTEKDFDRYGRQLGHAFYLMWTRLENAGKHVPQNVLDMCFARPITGVGQLNLRCIAERVLDEADSDLLGYYIGNAPEGMLATLVDESRLRGGFALGNFWYHDVPALRAAERLGVTRQAISKLVKEGKLDGVKVGSPARLMISHASLDSYARRAGKGACDGREA